MSHGHKNRTYWNVSLWLNNDEALYRAMKHCRRHNPTARRAAECMLEELHALGIEKTPDGHKYTVPAIQAAMRGL